MLSENDAKEFVTDRHRYWHSILLREFKSGPHCPQVEFLDDVFTHCGQYDGLRNACAYSLPTAIVVATEFDETIAHEICHAFVGKIAPLARSHGSEFIDIMRNICGFEKADAYAHYSKYMLSIRTVSNALKQDSSRVKATSTLGTVSRLSAMRSKLEARKGSQ